MLDQDTKRRIDSARQILVGKVPDPKAQVEQITTALIYKFMDDMDRESEELGGSAKFLTGKLIQFSWGRLLSKELSGQERMIAYMDALAAFAKADQIPELFRSIFKGTFLPYRDPETLNLFLKEINSFTYDHSEELGNAFEYLLSILGSQGDAGQFRTPRHIIDFIVEVVNPQKNECILDPACGTAGFLISTYKHIKHQNSSNYKQGEYIPSFSKGAEKDVSLIEIQSDGQFTGDLLSHDDRMRLGKNIIGYDISPDMVRLSLVNMYLHGFSTPQIFEYDSLTYEDRWGELFDVILANPPFMTPKGGIRPHKRFQISANRSEVLFVDYIAEHLSLKGRAGVIVPEGIIFQSSNAYKHLRKMLVEDGFLWSVVSLPSGIFRPYSGVKTSILFLDKERARKNDEILFIKIINDGYDLGDQRRAIGKNDLPKAFKILQEWQRSKKAESQLANWIGKKIISESGEYNLTGDRYYEAIEYDNVKWELRSIGDVCEVISGQSPPGKYYNTNGEGTPFFQGKAEFTKKYIGLPVKWTTKVTKLAEPGDILMSVRAPVGPVNMTKSQLCIGRGLAAIRAKDLVRNDYLFYILRDRQGLIMGNAGSTFASINRRDIQSIMIPLPSIEIQKEIVEELNGYENIIDGGCQIVENWKPTIKVDSKWEMFALGDLCNINPKKSEVKEIPSGTLVSFVPMESINEHQIAFEPKENRKLKDVYKGYTFFKDQDVLLAKVTPCFENGKSGVAKKLTNGIGFGTTELIVLRPGNRVKSEWIYYFISSKAFQNQGRNHMSGTGGLKRLTKHFVENYQIPVPTLKEQTQIINQIINEQQSILSARKLIEIHRQKIRDKISEIYGE